VDEIDDPYFDPDDPRSDHLLYEGGLDPALSIVPDAPEFVREREVVDQGATWSPRADADDERTAADVELAKARFRAADRAHQRVRPVEPGDQEQPASGVPGASGPVPRSGEDQPGGGGDNPGADDDLGRVKLYLAKGGRGRVKTDTKRARHRAARPEHFSSAHIIFETGNVKHLRDGRTEIQIFVPYDGKTEAVKLTDSYGMLLEAKVQPVKRKMP
jgi:hypothetical protein